MGGVEEHRFQSQNNGGVRLGSLTLQPLERTKVV